MSITEADVQHIAALARLGLNVDRLPSLVSELNGILGHMDVLQQVKLPAGDVLPVGAQRAAMPLRQDTVHTTSTIGDIGAIAPAVRDGFFLVPRLSTHGELGGTGDADEMGHS